MDKLVGAIGAAFGSSLAKSLGAVIMWIAIFVVVAFFLSALIVLICFFLSLKYYRAGRSRAFLVASSITAFFSSFLIAIIGSSKITHNLVFAPPIFIGVLIFAIIFIRRLDHTIKKPPQG